MDELTEKNPLVLWSFWLACGLAVTGGIAPLVLAVGGPNRIGGAIIPFTIAAGAMGANALLYQRGRPLATALYFLAGVAIVYGMLAMFAVPLRLAVVGTCPASPAVCPVGLERSFSSGEATGFSVGILMGVASILSGFFGLLILYRRRPLAQVAPPMARVAAPRAEPPPAQPDVAPEAAAPQTLPPREPEREPASSAPAPPLDAAPKPRARRAPKPRPELPPPASPLELPASSAPAEQGSDTPSST